MAHFSNRVASEAIEDMEDNLTDVESLAREAMDRLLFENGEWAVTDAGMEHKRTGYFIAREDFCKKRSDGLWAWPMHMLEKAWCSPQAFIEASARAVLAYGVKPDPDLERSFLAAAHAQAEKGMWRRMARELGLRDPAVEAISLGELAKIGVEICRRRTSGRAAGVRAAATRRGEPAERRRRHG